MLLGHVRGLKRAVGVLEVFRLRVSLCIKFKAPRLVKVKAHSRFRYGKKEKVRSYYRIAVGR